MVFVDADNRVVGTGDDPAEALPRRTRARRHSCAGTRAGVDLRSDPCRRHRPAPTARPPPGWTLTADVVVVGSGVAGLTAALHAAAPGSVLLVTKVLVDDGSTRWAQGGVAAALDPADSPEEHLQDTLVAGVGLCDEDAVRVLCTEGPARLRELVALGAAFDRDASGELSLTREGGHGRNRIVHAGGDATGAEVSRALVAAVRAHPAHPSSSSTRWCSTCCRTRTAGRPA